jgi:hypothetical protein
VECDLVYENSGFFPKHAYRKYPYQTLQKTISRALL